MLYACAARFNITKNFEKVLNFGRNTRSKAGYEFKFASSRPASVRKQESSIRHSCHERLHKIESG
jgi:hypothetical protein